MRWDFLLFFASLAATALGGEWGAYLGVAGMAVFGAHGIVKALPSRKARQMAIMIGLIASGSIFLTLLFLYAMPTWFGLANTRDQSPVQRQPSATPQIASEKKEEPAAPIEWRDLNNVENVFGFNDAVNDSGLLVSVFRFIGINRSTVPITNVKARVMPRLAKDPLTLGFVERGPIIPTAERFIEPGAEFSVAYIIPPSDSRNRQGVTVDEYLKTYGAFDFHFEYDLDGKSQVFFQPFSYQTVADWLRAKEQAWNEAHKRPPGIQRYK